MDNSSTSLRTMFSRSMLAKNWGVSPLFLLLGLATTMMTAVPIYTLGKPDVVSIDKSNPVVSHDRAEEGRRWRFLNLRHGNPDSAKFDQEAKALREKLGPYRPRD